MASHILTSEWQRVERLFSPLSSPALSWEGSRSPWGVFSIPNLQALSHLTLTFISTLVQGHTANQEFIFLNKTLFPDSSKFRARKVFKSVVGEEHREK